MKVSNMRGHSGREVPNQFIITDEGRGANGNFIKREVFQSYNSVIAVRTFWRQEDIEGIPNAKTIEIELDSTYWDYSTTTGKYRNLFLGEDKKETERKIKNGTYTLTNLN